MVLVVMQYDLASGYVPASPRFADLYADAIEHHLAQAKEATPGELGEWDGSTKCGVLPVLLVVGLATRLGALGLFVLNYVAVISFPDMGAVGIKDHVLWGVMLAMIFFHGPGRLSVDQWLSRRAALR